MPLKTRTLTYVDQEDGQGRGYRIATLSTTHDSGKINIELHTEELTIAEAGALVGSLMKIALEAADTRTVAQRIKDAVNDELAKQPKADEDTDEAPASTLGYHGASRVDEQGEDLWADA